MIPIPLPWSKAQWATLNPQELPPQQIEALCSTWSSKVPAAVKQQHLAVALLAHESGGRDVASLQALPNQADLLEAAKNRPLTLSRLMAFVEAAAATAERSLAQHPATRFEFLDAVIIYATGALHRLNPVRKKREPALSLIAKVRTQAVQAAVDAVAKQFAA